MAVDLKKELSKALSKFGKPIGVKSCTLTLFTSGTRTPGALSAGTNPTSVDYPCKGFIESYSAHTIDGTLVKSEDRKISILGGSLPTGIVPVPEAKITIVDVDGVSKTFRVIGRISDAPGGGAGVSADPVGAVYSSHCRK